MHIAIYAVCKNGARFAQRWCDAVKGADSVTVLDTGSTDNSIAILKANGVHVFQYPMLKWRADEARNQALDCVPGCADVCLSLDMDEVLQPGWREPIESKWVPGETSYAWYTFVWTFYADGTPEIQFEQYRMHRRYGVKWLHRRHETLEYDGPTKQVIIHEVAVHHHPDWSDKPKREGELESLEEDHAEFDSNLTAYYLGREYYYNNKMDQAFPLLRRVAAASDVPDFVPPVCQLLCRLTRQLHWAILACQVYATRENLMFAGDAFLRSGMPLAALEFGNRALQVKSGLRYNERNIDDFNVNAFIALCRNKINVAETFPELQEIHHASACAD